MKKTVFDSREEWLAARRGKITGSRVKDIIVKRGSAAHKIGFYELIAEYIAVEPDDENAMDRGTRLEDEALARFSEETGKVLDTSLVLWTRDDNPNIGVSPDAAVAEDDTEAVEAKCLSSARHLEALLENKIPAEYEEQAKQYFVVNDKLKTLYFVFYDPRILAKDFFYITITRESVEDEVKYLLDYQQSEMAEVLRIVNELTF